MASDFHRRAARLFALVGTIAVSGLVVGSVVVTATAYSEAYTAFMRLVLRTSPARPMSMRFIT